MKEHPVTTGNVGWAMVMVTVMVALLTGCCSTQQPPRVSVREGIHRSELTHTNRIELPLSADGRDFALRFLRTGRNPHLDPRAPISDPEADQRYAGLLDLLGSDLVVSNLVADRDFNATATFRPWFPTPAVRQVLDAREDFVPVRQPYAFLDASGKYWWVFYHRRKQLLEVLITRATPTRMER
jgi:hypothetical protein